MRKAMQKTDDRFSYEVVGEGKFEAIDHSLLSHSPAAAWPELLC
jgi:hypothetical protein